MSAYAELQAWRNGTVNGGPNGDGRYPLTDGQGQVYLLLCPAADKAANEDLAVEPEIFATLAGEAKDAAVAAQVAAQASATAADAAAATSSAEAAAASNSAAAAATSAATATAQADIATTEADAASGSAVAAEASRAAADTAKTAAEAAQASAALSASTATTKATAADASAIAAADSALTASAANTSAQAASTAADASKVAAADSATTATGAASTATTKADSANTSANDAAGYATTAATRAGEASASSTSASGSATSAANSADEAHSWALTAQAAATGALHYMPGGWDASTGAFPTGAAQGDFWKVSVAGTISGVNLAVGDHLIWSGSGWDVIDNTESVTTVAGRIGNVVIAKSDIAGLQADLDGKQLSLGYTPVQQGTGIGQLPNTVKIGWKAGSKLGLTIDSADSGNIALEDWVTTRGYAPANNPNLSGTVNLPSAAGFTSISNGTGDSATYATYNTKLKLWYGLGIESFDGVIRGVYDSRAGRWDTKGGYRVDGQDVWHAGNFDPATKANLSGADFTGNVTTSGELQTTAQNGIRMVSGQWGAFFRHDGNDLYLLITAANDQYGTWNTLRPLRINLATGAFTIGNGLTVGGALSASGAISAPNITSTVVGNNIVQRNASGYIMANYINTTANDIGAGTPSHIAVQTGSDSYLRWQTPANFRAVMKTPAIYVQSADPGAQPDGTLWFW